MADVFIVSLLLGVDLKTEGMADVFIVSWLWGVDLYKKVMGWLMSSLSVCCWV